MPAIPTSLAPWLSVRDSSQAIEFYKSAFAAVEVFTLDGGGSIIARLSIDGAEFWVADESPEHGNFSPTTLNGSTVRMILTVANPDAFFARAIQAGGSEIYPVHDESYGWRVGRLTDPYGHNWEICRPLAD
jgi:PhnB protein